MKHKKISIITPMILVLTYILSAVFRFLIIKNSPYMYDRFCFTFTAKAVLFLALGVAGYIIASKYGNGILEKYGWIFGVLGCIMLLCERHFWKVELLQSIVLLINPIATVGTAAYVYHSLKNKNWKNWMVALLPMAMLLLFGNVWRMILIAVLVMMILFAVKEKNQNKGILIFYSLLILAGIGIVLTGLVPAYTQFRYQIHEEGYMVNVIAEGLRTAKLFGAASLPADGDRQIFSLYYIIMNWGYLAAGILVALLGVSEVFLAVLGHRIKNTSHRFAAYTVFLLLLINTIISLLINFGVVISGFFTVMPIVSFNFFEALSVLTVAGIAGTKE